MVFIWAFLIFYAGVTVGYITRVVLARHVGYNGLMVVNKEEGKVVYSLILEDYPEKLEFQKEVLLKVVSSEDVSVRT